MAALRQFCFLLTISLLIVLVAACPLQLDSASAAPVQSEKIIYVGVQDGWLSPMRHKIYAYDAANLELLDSIPFLPAYPTDIQVSPSGNRLYVTAQGNGYTFAVYAFDPVAAQVHWQFPDTLFDDYWFTFLYNNSELLMFGRNVLDAANGTLVRRLPQSIRPFEGPPAGSRILAAFPSVDTWLRDTLRVLDLLTGEMTGGVLPRLSSGAPLGTYWGVLHPDVNSALVLGYENGTGVPWYSVIDLNTGQSLLEGSMAHGEGRPRMSVDGGIAVVTDPSIEGFWDSEGTVDVLDLNTMVLLKRFNLGRNPANFYGQVAFIETQPRAVLGGKPGGFNAAGFFSLLDLDSLSIGPLVPLPHADSVAVILGGIAVGDRCVCCCACHGDPACDRIRVDVRDVVKTIEVAIRGALSIDPYGGCPSQPSDVDCSGITDIIDVMKVIDVAFRAVEQNAAFCEPCSDLRR